MQVYKKRYYVVYTEEFPCGTIYTGAELGRSITGFKGHWEVYEITSDLLVADVDRPLDPLESQFSENQD